MMEWYYEKNGDQNGPVSLEQLQSLLAAGAIQTHNLVWKPGMADWQPYGDVFPTVAPEPQQRAKPLSRHEAPLRTNAQLRARARRRLDGNWGAAALVVFLNQFLRQVPLMLLPGLGIIITWVISGPLSLGCRGYFLGLARRERVTVGTLFDGFSDFGRGLLIFLLVGAIIGVGALAAAIPGGILLLMANPQSVAPEESPLFLLGVLLIVLGVSIVGYYLWLRYALVYFIALDEPDMTAMQVLSESSRMMAGQKNRLLYLSASFIGWHILGFFAFGIGLFWSTAYMTAAYAAFYDDLRGRVR